MRGAQHRRLRQPRQDALRWHKHSDLSLIMVAADGHGGKRCFRSQIGAWIAVMIACKMLAETSSLPTLPELHGLATDKIPQLFVRNWLESVNRHQQRKPFTVAELALLGNADPVVAYGTTLLTTLVTNDFIAYWQLGDGDILTVWEDGTVERPLPADKRLFANETTSLCGEQAWRDFRYQIQPISHKAPELILLCTDGYSNSFADDEGLKQAGRDILELLKTEGVDYVKNHLPDWLHQTSAAGSGDDVAVGLIWQKMS